MVLRHEKFSYEQDSNPDFCNAGAVLYQLNYQADWELVVMWVDVFEQQTSARSEQFPYLTSLHTTTFLFLSILSLVETVSSNSGRDLHPGIRNVHFQFPSVAQKHCLLKLSNNNPVQ